MCSRRKVKAGVSAERSRACVTLSPRTLSLTVRSFVRSRMLEAQGRRASDGEGRGERRVREEGGRGGGRRSRGGLHQYQPGTFTH